MVFSLFGVFGVVGENVTCLGFLRARTLSAACLDSLPGGGIIFFHPSALFSSRCLRLNALLSMGDSADSVPAAVAVVAAVSVVVVAAVSVVAAVAVVVVAAVSVVAAVAHSNLLVL